MENYLFPYRAGRLKGVRVGRLRRIRQEDLESFLDPKDTGNLQQNRFFAWAPYRHMMILEELTGD